MPQFFAGATKTAKVTMRNPAGKAFDYHAALYMGVDQVAMAEADFRLNAGESKEVSFSVIMPAQVGVYPVYLSAFSSGQLLAHYQGADVEIVPRTLALGYSNPKQSSTHWHVRIQDLITRLWSEDFMPIPIGDKKALPSITSPEFLAVFRESYNVFFNDYQYGPLAILVPELKEYIWRASSESMPGASSIINLPLSTNRCKITGYVTGVATGIVAFRLDATEGIPGYVNAGKYFVGTGVSASTTENTVGLTGNTITATLEMVKVLLGGAGEYGYTFSWQVTGIKLASVDNYPPAAYSFQGGITVTRNFYWQGMGKAVYSVSSNYLSSFRAATVLRNEEYNEESVANFVGPASGELQIPCYCTVSLWANPNPAERFTSSVMAIQRGWVQVAAATGGPCGY